MLSSFRSPVSMLMLSLSLVVAGMTGAASGQETNGADDTPNTAVPQSNGQTEMNDADKPATLKTATFGGGCFWCVEAVFQRLKGVEKVASGYMGGQVDNPTYEQVCSGQTGHAEVIQITYDESQVSFDVLLQVFWKTHDPTTLNRQGNDVGTQYRSAVFYHDAQQQELAQSYIKKLNEEKAFPNPVVTEVAQASKFYEAEDYHQNYWNEKGRGNGYCVALIPPKLEKLKKVFGDKLKK